MNLIINRQFKLAGPITVNNRAASISILEAVIKQTSIYSSSRKGRISVFWGDQIFIPSVSCEYVPKHHVDILATLNEMPNEQAWIDKGLHKYGLIAVAENGDASQVEKVSYQQTKKLIENKQIDVEGGIGVSLGSFSISWQICLALLAEFEPELNAKSGKLDTDPHFWMPMTLELDTYQMLMSKKGVDSDQSADHYHRMQQFIGSFMQKHDDLAVFSCVDIGADAYWWDYGQLRFYLDNNRKLLDDTTEAAAMRTFFNIEQGTG